MDISEGPLSDSSKEEESGSRSGLALNLTIGDEGNIYFSPGGSEGFIFASPAPQQGESGLVPPSSHEDTSSTPREILDEFVFRQQAPLASEIRSVSPSVASGVSSASSVAGRRNLEWDSGADLGYVGDIQPQRKAAAGLSALEKLAIGNYTEYLKNQESSAEDEFQMRKLRLNKYADSFLKRRPFYRDFSEKESKSSTESPPSIIHRGRAPRLRRSNSLSELRRCSPTPMDCMKRRGSSPLEPSSSSSAGTIVPFTDLESERTIHTKENRIDDSSVSRSSLTSSKKSFDTVIESGGGVRRRFCHEDEIPTSSSYFPPSSSQEDEEKSEGRWESDKEDPSRQNVENNYYDEDYEHPHGTSEDEVVVRRTSEFVRIDRAKSFEYFPGESYRRDINSSSSYEYMPGHLVEQRVEVPIDKNVRGKEKKNSSSKVLLKTYKRKLRQYILILSTPSLTYKESKTKQKLAEKLMDLMKEEEEDEEEEIDESHSSSISSTSSMKLCRDIKKLEKLERKLLANQPFQINQAEMSMSTASSSAIPSEMSISSNARSSYSLKTSPEPKLLQEKRIGQKSSKPKSTERSNSRAFGSTSSISTSSSSGKAKKSSKTVIKQIDLSDAEDRRYRREFGQNFPTPTLEKAEESAKNDDSLAYFVPLDNERPERIMKKSVIYPSHKEHISNKENRNVLSNYMAGLSVNPVRPREHKSRSLKTKAPECITQSASLQESLRRGNPGFLKRSQRRVIMLRESRRRRLEESERRKKWLEELARLSPKTRRRAEHTYIPAKVKRVFNYRKMVEDSKRRYQNLPEVRKSRNEHKQRQSYKTNRIMSEIYNRKLKQNALRRRVHSAH